MIVVACVHAVYCYCVYIIIFVSLTKLPMWRIKLNMCRIIYVCKIYADKLISIAPTITEQQCLLNICESELVKLDMCINVSKSTCFNLDQNSTSLVLI